MIEQNTLRRRGTGLIAADPAAASPGFTLFAPLTGTGQVYLVPMWHKYHGGALCEVAPDGTILREHRDDFHHHDAHHFGAGRILYTAVEPLTGAGARAIPGGIPGSEAAGPFAAGTVYADVIKETGPDGAIAWTWHAAEHLDPDRYPLQPHYRREHWPLINSVYPLADGNILASLRSVSAVIIIDRGTGKVIWHLGPGTVAQQHCASELPDGSILLFDNGTFRTAESVTYSRVIEVDRQRKAITWDYRDSPAENFFTPFMGSVQRLPNGNTLITESAFGRIFEVTRSGQVCWEYVVPYFSAYRDRAAAALFPAPANAIFRAYRYTASELPRLSSRPGPS
jgi:hypothetical protein